MKMNDNDAQFMAGMLQQAVFDLEDTKHELTRLQAEFVKGDDTYTAGTLDGMIKKLKRNVETQKDQLETYANFASVGYSNSDRFIRFYGFHHGGNFCQCNKFCAIPRYFSGITT